MSKDEAIKQLQGMVVGAEWLSDSMVQALSVAIEALSADVVSRESYESMERTVNLLNKALQKSVELVRCKDCKHHEELLNNNDGNVLCWVHDIDVIVDENGYCSYGERKEQEHE